MFATKSVKPSTIHSFSSTDKKNTSFVQPKLTIGKSDDKFEVEADKMADKIVAKKNEQSTSSIHATLLKVQRQPKDKDQKIGKEKLQEIPISNFIAPPKQIQKQENEEIQLIEDKNIKDDDKETQTIQNKSLGENGDESTSIENDLNSSKGGGNSLDTSTKNEMESGFGTDFSEVKVHNDSNAVQMNQKIGAQAFTSGNDIYFNEGKYNPTSNSGKHLLAHELTHTVQQSSAIQMKVDIQRSIDIEALKRQIIESNKEQVDAFDPSEATQTRENANEEGVKAEQTANQEIKVAPKQEVQVTDDKAPETPRVSIPVSQKPDKVIPSLHKNKKKKEATEKESLEVTKGETLEYLEQKSANVCGDGAEKAQKLADNESAHDTAKDKANQTDTAIVPPAEEGQSRSNADQVNTLDGAETPKSDDEKMKQEMDAAITAAIPAKVKDLNEFESQKKAQVIGNKVLASTAKQVGEVQGTYNKIEQAPDPKESDIPKELPEIEQAPVTELLNIGKDAVPSVPKEQTDLSSFEEDADNIYEKEGISTDMQAEFENVDSGDIADANKEKSVLKEKVANEPSSLQAFSKQEQHKVDKDLQKEEGKIKTSMQEKRKKELNNTKDKQEKTKTAIELKREAVTNWINTRYTTAKDLVTKTLGELETNALSTFDAGQNKYSKQFEKNVKRRVNAWKSDRYSGVFGGVKWLKDKIVGIDDFPEIEEIFRSERETFVSAVDALIITINTENEKTIKSCKDEIELAKKDIQEYITNLDPDVKQAANKAKEETSKKLAELDQHIDKEKKKLQQKLCDKKDEAIKAIDKKIEEMKSEMSGLVSKLGALLLYAAKKFFKWAIEKIGGSSDKILSILDKGATVLKKLFTDPIGFFKNLVKAVGGGIKGFVTNILEWLKKGLASWLLGQMGDSGLQLPEKFDLRGIMHLGLQVAGLTWNVIRPRIVKQLGPKGEKIMSAAEKSVDIIKRVIKEGPVVLWDIIMEKAGEIKEKVLEGVRNWASMEIIKKMSFKLLSMLNPAGAIFQAIMLLYDVVMFFIENWNRIIDFVKSVFDSIGAIASGAIGQAAGFIEKTLGKTIPMILSFAARFVGLSGIGKAVKKVIKTIQKPFKKILDKMIKFLVKQVNKLVKSGKVKVKGVVKGLLQWWKKEKKFKGKDGKAHRLFFKGTGKKAVLTVASEPTAITKFLIDKEKEISGDKSKVKAALKISKEIDTIKSKIESTKKDTTKKQLESGILPKMNQLVPLVSELMSGKNKSVKLVDDYLGKKVFNKDGSVNRKFVNAFDSKRNKIDNKKVYLYIETKKDGKVESYFIKRNVGRLEEGYSGIFIDNNGVLQPGKERKYIPDHENFIPKEMIITEKDGIYTATYKTLTSDKKEGPSFKIDMLFGDAIKDIPDVSEVRNVEGKNLSNKVKGKGRGKWDSGSDGFDNAHIIGDQFGGSGKNSNINIHPSSPNYNQKEMADVEREMAKYFEERGAENYNMEVTAHLNEENESPNLLEGILKREFKKDNKNLNGSGELIVKAESTLIKELQESMTLDIKNLPAKFKKTTYKSNSINLEKVSLKNRKEKYGDKYEENKFDEHKLSNDKKTISIGEDVNYEEALKKYKSANVNSGTKTKKILP